MKWTKELEGKLIENIDKGFTFLEIDSILNLEKDCSKNKAKRLGLKSKSKCRNIVKSKCLNCKSDIVDLESKNRKFCNRSCSVSYNNLGTNKNTRKYKYNENCSNCNKKIEGSGRKYCSRECSQSGRIKETYDNYLNNQSLYSDTFICPKTIKKHILSEQEGKCNICKCDNIHNGKILVFIMDHIDGNAKNNLRENLRCVCPNCDSQLDTYKSKNKNSSRHYSRYGKVKL